MFDNEVSEGEIDPSHDREHRRVKRRSRLRTSLNANIITFLVYMVFIDSFQAPWTKPVTLTWLLILVIHAMIVASQESRRAMHQVEIKRKRQDGYYLEKPKRRLTLGDDGELIEVNDPAMENPKRKQYRSENAD